MSSADGKASVPTSMGPLGWIFAAFAYIPVLHFCSDGGWIASGIEDWNLADAALALFQCGPNGVDIMPQRVHHSDTSYNNSATHL